MSLLDALLIVRKINGELKEYKSMPAGKWKRLTLLRTRLWGRMWRFEINAGPEMDDA